MSENALLSTGNLKSDSEIVLCNGKEKVSEILIIYKISVRSSLPDLQYILPVILTTYILKFIGEEFRHIAA